MNSTNTSSARKLSASSERWLARVPAGGEVGERARHYPVMSNIKRDRRLVPVPLDIQQHAARLVDELGPRGAAKRLGVSRDTALSLAHGLDVMPGSIALARLAMGEGS